MPGAFAKAPPDIGAFLQQPKVNQQLSIGILGHRHVRGLRLGRRQPPIVRSEVTSRPRWGGDALAGGATLCVAVGPG